MKAKGILFIIFILGIIACNQTKKESNHDGLTEEIKLLPPLNLSNQLYFLVPQIDSVTCKVTGGCDCCASHLLFLNDSEFVCASYCVESNTYFRGTYKVNVDEILFQADSLRIEVVSSYVDSVTNETIIETRKEEKVYSFKWKEFLCNNEIRFIDKRIDYTEYAVPDEDRKNEFIEATKKDSVWYKLEME